MSSTTPTPLRLVPAPWTLKAKIWTMPVYVTSKMTATLSADKDFMYSATERSSGFSSDKFVGGLALAQVIRYSESPVGSYDELLLMPGYFERVSSRQEKNGTVTTKKSRNARVTKIFVSQKDTCYSGRKNWNIPKHLADFRFTDRPNGGISISVYPFTPDSSGLETIPSPTPLVSATYTPISYLPSFPVSTGWARYLGINLNFVQPPLPAGKDEELTGTEEWAEVAVVESSRRASMGWWDLRQVGEVGEESALLGEEVGAGQTGQRAGAENWWPGVGRWRLGMVMEDADVLCPVGTHWKGEK